MNDFSLPEKTEGFDAAGCQGTARQAGHVNSLLLEAIIKPDTLCLSHAT